MATSPSKMLPSQFTVERVWESLFRATIPDLTAREEWYKIQSLKVRLRLLSTHSRGHRPLRSVSSPEKRSRGLLRRSPHKHWKIRPQVLGLQRLRSTSASMPTGLLNANEY